MLPLCVWVCVYVKVCVCVYVKVCAHESVSVCMYVRPHVRMHMCACACVCVTRVILCIASLHGDLQRIVMGVML